MSVHPNAFLDNGGPGGKQRLVMPALDIVLVSAGTDWCGLYVNGTLRHQGHGVPTHVWLEVLGGEEKPLSEAAMEEAGELPSLFRDIEWDVAPQDAPMDAYMVRRLST